MVSASSPGTRWRSFKTLLSRRRIGSETGARFARGLADLAEAGVPILQAIDVLAHEPSQDQEVLWGARERQDDRDARAILREVRRSVAQGSSLAEALGKI